MGRVGYAVTASSYTAILEHYYGTLSAGGSTSVGTSPSFNDSTSVSVALTENTNGDNEDVLVTSDSAFTAGGASVPANGAALVPLDGNDVDGGDEQQSAAPDPGARTCPVVGGPVADTGGGRSPFPATSRAWR